MTTPDPLEDLVVTKLGTGPLTSEVQRLEVDGRIARQKDRSLIARWVVAVFLVVVVLLLLYVLAGPVLYGWDAIKAPSEYAATTIGSVLLPVVTLVLGYYFGTGDRSP